jgi:hypothetical protein
VRSHRSILFKPDRETFHILQSLVKDRTERCFHDPTLADQLNRPDFEPTRKLSSYHAQHAGSCRDLCQFLPNPQHIRRSVSSQLRYWPMSNRPMNLKGCGTSVYAVPSLAFNLARVEPSSTTAFAAATIIKRPCLGAVISCGAPSTRISAILSPTATTVPSAMNQRSTMPSGNMLDAHSASSTLISCIGLSFKMRDRTCSIRPE